MPAFGVDIKQIIHLLGKHLYPSDEVVVRELVQNAHDSIRNRYGDESSHFGKIDIVIDSRTLSITDNGLGMDDKELNEYLSTLGEGIQRHKSAIERQDSGTIGEFGIGFFSSFIIADHIDLRTRRTDNPTTYRWRSRGTDGYDVTESAKPLDIPGTSICLHLQPHCAATYGDPERVADIVRRHCNFLDCDIHLNFAAEPLNERTFAWECTSDTAIVQWCQRHLNSHSTYHTAGIEHAGTIRFGYAFSCGTPSDSPKRSIYCKRMFVTDNTMFVSQYLGFVDVAIGCDGLNLSLSRNQVQHDATSARLFARVEELIFDWIGSLVRLHRQDPTLLTLIRHHQEAFRQLALDDHGFLTKLYPHLLFRLYGQDTAITLSEYRERAPLLPNKVIYVATHRMQSGADRERLLLAICEDRRIPVISVQDDDEQDLLRKVCLKFKLDRLPLKDSGPFLEGTASNAGAALQRVRANVQNFLGRRARLASLPVDVPIAFVNEEVLINEANAYVNALASLEVDFERLRPIYDSFLRIFATLDRAEIGKAILGGLVDEICGTLKAWGVAVETWEQDRQRLLHLTDRWWQGPMPLSRMPVKERKFRVNNRDYRMRCFVVCPFRESYRDVVNAVTGPCEQAGILAELADELETSEILAKVCRYVDRCDFAIVDISEDRPNIFFELGLLLARRKPVILINSTERRIGLGMPIPTDIIGVERIEYTNTSEDLRSQLSKVLERLS